MRLTSETWVSALVRRIHGEGGFAAVLRRGNDQAGAVFITIRERDGSVRLLVPAPQSLVESTDRRFAERNVADEDEIGRILAGEQRFDSDLWVVEIEGLAGPLADYLNVVPEDRI